MADGNPEPWIPLKERWEVLKPEIQKLYLDEEIKLADLINVMKERHGFDAHEHQYKYQFKKWGWRKNISKRMKDAILERSRSRFEQGKSTKVRVKRKRVDPEKLLRGVKSAKFDATFDRAIDKFDDCRPVLFGTIPHFRHSIFLNWSRPFVAADGLQSPRNHLSLKSPSRSPSDISLRTPSPTTDTRDEALTKALRYKSVMDNTKLFVQGRHAELMKVLGGNEKRIMSHWLYQFWLFSFQTAKCWGQEPRYWTAERLGFSNSEVSWSIASPLHQAVQALESIEADLTADNLGFGSLGSWVMDCLDFGNPETWTMDNLGFNYPGNDPGIENLWPIQSPMHYSAPGSIKDDLEREYTVPKPTQLCHWSVHVSEDHDFRGSDSEWPEDWIQPPFEERLKNGLENNDFSNISTDQLPVSLSHVAKAAETSPGKLLEEALGFSIMAGRADLVLQQLEKLESAGVDVERLHPLHLAASYLNGSTSCCQVLHLLSTRFYHKANTKSMTNHLGHTVLDTLMLTILKNHTAVHPGMVDEALKTDHRFAGEEVDICGRWDANSDCYRQLLKSGQGCVPFEWKHKFCHTSAQAICHCIRVISWPWIRDDEKSGLFLKHCSRCGFKMPLQPLHALVLIAYHVGKSGCPGEDLFGMICCLLSLLDKGLDPSATADISLALLFGMDDDSICSHTTFSPYELCEELQRAWMRGWSAETYRGWQIFRLILRRAADVRSPEGRRLYRQLASIASDESIRKRADDEDSWGLLPLELGFTASCDNHLGGYQDEATFGSDRILGHIWAGAQTELLNYRRESLDDAWISPNFDIEAVLRSLEKPSQPSMGFIDEEMMLPYCACGRFRDLWRNPQSGDVAAYGFSNLDDWIGTYLINDSWTKKRVSDY